MANGTMVRARTSLLSSCARTSPSSRAVFCLLKSFSSSSSYYVDDEPPALVRLEEARLGYRRTTLTKPLNLTVNHPTWGGHVLLGRNGLGKTLLSNALVSHGDGDYLHEGNFITDENRQFSSSTMTAHVSFESHEALLEEGGTTYRAIGTGNLNKAAQFLIVRFGLFPLLHREVSTLSTGEIRKVLLVRALSNRPRLLVLDNAFDGLDVPSRQNLKDLVSKTLNGFRADILVQGVNASATAHTQVLMITQRAEEIVKEIQTVSFLDKEQNLVTEARDKRSSMELLSRALSLDESESSINGDYWNDATLQLPSVDSISSWWQSGRDKRSKTEESSQILVRVKGLFHERGDATLIHSLSWSVQRGERWLVAGANGSGKSTLSRLVAKYKEQGVTQHSTGILDVTSKNIGWVSTELHMSMARSNKVTMQVLQNNGKTPPDVAISVLKWLQLDESILSRPFAELSQGQQKLVLVAAALAFRPELLVLDEPCQGLDLIHRQRMLALVERVCQATDMSLVYITHHIEEMLPSVGHVLHLQDGRAVFNGRRQDYDPEAVGEIYL